MKEESSVAVEKVLPGGVRRVHGEERGKADVAITDQQFFALTQLRQPGRLVIFLCEYTGEPDEVDKYLAGECREYLNRIEYISAECIRSEARARSEERTRNGVDEDVAKFFSMLKSTVPATA